ncbi:DUF3159 domain-containing protein [Cryptosporangium sp. NPDC048952]|uniref:DUF3159 domain-containing protein n=1 Tax=Cryptosporangium sp. NPDC048952 TaxID=3363961 RepID=UPI003717B1AB
MTDHRARPPGEQRPYFDADERKVEDEQLTEAIFGDKDPNGRVADIIADEAAQLVADVPPGDPGARRRVVITPPEAPADEAVDDGEKDDEQISIADQVREQLGGIRGLVESSLPVLVFILANMATSLKPALWAAVGSAALIAAYRLIRKDSVRHALNGLFAVGIAAFIAARTGQAEDFYLLNIARNSGGALVCAGSVLFRRPVIGYAWRFISQIPPGWRESKPLLRAFSLISLVWALMFAIRAAVQIYLWSQHNADALGWASLAMGWPMFGACLLFTVWYGRKAIASVGGTVAADH